jgi:putative membrane protein
MSYLNDPRVFLANERTLLAWIRTEISILALVFVLKKFGYENLDHSLPSIDFIVEAICYVVIVLSILATVQATLTIAKLGPSELPSKIAKPMVIMTGIISILICIGGAVIVHAL